MELINSSAITTLEEAQIAINGLQSRLLRTEQALEDLARSLELAAATGQLYLTDSFRQAAEELLKDKIQVPAEGENEDFKVVVIE